MTGSRRGLLVGAVLLAVAGCAAPSQEARFAGRLEGAQQVPPSQSAASGRVAVTLDRATRTMEYTVAFADLSGPVTMLHFHSPAGPGANAGIRAAVVGVRASPITGQVTLTPEEMKELLAGEWYLNVHTPDHPGGEIRGQLIPQ